MLNIKKYTSIIIRCYFLVTIVVAFQQNTTKNNSKQFQKINKDLINQTSIENLTTLDYYFFSYDVIDHRTLLIKFDITRTTLYQHIQTLYDAYLYVSKIPSINYRIDIGPFSGIYEKELDGTIIDHFILCLVLVPNRNQTNLNITLNKNKTKTIYDEFLISSYQEQLRIIHYCTKMGPDEDRHRHHIKQGSKGDHVLLLLQVMLIVIFLVVLQIAQIIRDRKNKKWQRRQIEKFWHELSSRKEYANNPNSLLEMPRFTTINNEELQQKEEEEEEEEERFLTLSRRHLPSPKIKRQQSRSPSPSIGPTTINTDDSSIEHILEARPWIQIPH